MGVSTTAIAVSAGVAAMVLALVVVAYDGKINIAWTTSAGAPAGLIAGLIVGLAAIRLALIIQHR